MKNSCCNHSKQPNDNGFVIHDTKCDNTNVQASGKSVSQETNCCSDDDDSSGSSSEDEGDCCSSHNDIEISSTSTQISNENSSNDIDDLHKNTSQNIKTNGIEVSYSVTGMDCPSCAASIEKALKQKDGIKTAIISYNTGKLKVNADHEDALQPVEDIVKKLGFSLQREVVSESKKVYLIEGMDCSSCALSIEKHVGGLADVIDAKVSFASGTLTADHTNSTSDIIKEVERLGYNVTLKNTDNNSRAVTKTSFLNSYGKINTSGALIAIGFGLKYTDTPIYIENILFAIAILLSGLKPMKSGWYALKSKSLDMNVLMSSAAIGAALIGEWFEGATVVFLFSFGTALQTSSMERTRNSIRGLMDLTPDFAWIKVGNELIQKAATEIEIDEYIIIKPGDRIPLDGEITEGHTSINQAPITGESIPIDKTIGDTVFAGTINESGSLTIKVTRLVKDTAIARIIHQVEEAQEQRAPTQAFIDRFSQYYTPIVFSIALALIIIPPLIGFGTWNEWIYRGLALLIVACPCALVISTPVAIVSAIGNAARNGVLIKGGTFLEKAGLIDAIAFDKTGTLTSGKPEVTSITTLQSSEEELLAIAYALEDYSTHPIAKTIVNYAKAKQITSAEGRDFKNITGKGVQAEIDGITHYAGNLKLFEELDTDISHHKDFILNKQSEGNTVVIIGTNTELLGVITVADTLRNTTVNALTRLKSIGVKQLAMLTGDNEGTARKIAETTNINRYFSELMPEDKVKAIKKLQAEGYHVAMVGDGINDAPALATADLGIAMGGAGTDTAMETADIVLMADNLEQLPHTMKLSRRALNIIKQNIWFSISIKLIALILIVPGWLTLWMAVLSDTGAAIIVVLNALRLLKVKA